MDDLSSISKELNLIALHQSSILRREVMEANCANFPELADKMAKNSLGRIERILKLLNLKVEDWLKNEIDLAFGKNDHQN